MATLTIAFTPPVSAPSNGYQVKYRVRGSTGAYTTISPQPTFSPVVITGLAPLTNYEGYIAADCGLTTSTIVNFLSGECFCPSGFAASSDNSYCYQTATTAPSVTYSSYCFATSQNAANYSAYGARIYKPGLTDSVISVDISAASPPPGDIDAQVSSAYWIPAGVITDGPMNRAGVWIDSNCDGIIDPLTAGVQTTIGHNYVNTGPARQFYIGVGADNQFTLEVNGVEVAHTSSPTSIENFRNWHVIPVTFLNGNNIINATATGDGSTNDAIAMIIYDNTLAQMIAATSDGSLNILFSTVSLRGTTYDIATCPTGYSLDTTGGPGAYTCTMLTTTSCTY